MRICFIHSRLTANVGDLACCPALYFEFPGKEIWIKDINEPNLAQEVQADAYIVGGGGLLHGGWNQTIMDLIRKHGRKVCIWGIGSNQHGAIKPTWPDWLSKAGLVGIRDEDNPYVWTPCVSCVHPAFKEQQRLNSQRHDSNELLVYEHMSYEIKLPGNPQSPVLKLRNSLPTAVEEFVRSALSAKAVITNSYHGAYWAMLLGRRILLYTPFSSRFYGLPPGQAVMVNESSWRIKLDTAQPAPSTYLQRCQIATTNFYSRVINWLDAL